ncbi:UNVERIFIED_CONTAM: hypothetical protein NCL1_45198 [Trichonephila clavipes]
MNRLRLVGLNAYICKRTLVCLTIPIKTTLPQPHRQKCIVTFQNSIPAILIDLINVELNFVTCLSDEGDPILQTYTSHQQEDLDP